MMSRFILPFNLNEIQMSLINLSNAAQKCTRPWSSSVIAKIGNANFKVLQMNETAYPNEKHSFAEVLLVVNGQLNLMIDHQTIVVKTGEMYVVPPNTPHSVTSGSHGTLVIIDN